MKTAGRKTVGSTSAARYGQHGYNIRRLTLDPFMRATAAEVPGVDVMMGARVRDLTTDGSGRVDGVIAEIGGERQRINGRLVVGADGYMSKVAEAGGASEQDLAQLHLLQRRRRHHAGRLPE